MRTKFIVRETRKYGRGVFASRTFTRGEVIHVLGGETISARALIARIQNGTENLDDPLQIGVRTYLDLDEISRTFNHSCDPNAALRKRSELFALRDIRKGEEITYDYSLTIAPTEWSMQCACGSPACRGTLGDVLSVPEVARQKYRELGAIQDYMRRLLTTIARGKTRRIPSYERAFLASLAKPSHV